MPSWSASPSKPAWRISSLLRYQTLSMNTLSDDGRWIGDDVLAELASQSVQNAVLGFQDPRLVLSHPCLDEVEAFDHYAPEECGQFPRQGLVGDRAAAPCRHAAVKAPSATYLLRAKARAITQKIWPARLRRRLTEALRLPL